MGRLIYLAHTRLDIAFAVSLVSQFMHCPYEEHLEATYRILRYLKAVQERVYCLGRTKAELWRRLLMLIRQAQQTESQPQAIARMFGEIW